MDLIQRLGTVISEAKHVLELLTTQRSDITLQELAIPMIQMQMLLLRQNLNVNIKNCF